MLNNYRKNIPWPEALYKDLVYMVNYWINFFRNGFKHKTLLFYPEYPTKRSVIWKVAKRMHYNISNNINRYFDVAFNWEDKTYRSSFLELEKISAHREVININCKDISKKYIDSAFHDIFGYSTSVDPTLHTGQCVKKNDLNAKHDGVVTVCPIRPEEVDSNFIYQIIINNQAGNNKVEDIRVPVIRDIIPFIYLKYRPLSNRFSNTNTFTLLKSTEEVLSRPECDKILEFTKKIGLDYGELDVLRDRGTGLIYIVDVNYTPYGPPNHLLKADARRAVKILAQTIQQKYQTP